MIENTPRSALPFEPPFCTSALPGAGGAIGPDPEDFRVDELPAYAASGDGEHRYVRIEKRSLTTPEAVRLIAEAAGVDARDIGYAGLKDKHAVTTQWLSLPKKSLAPEQWKLPPGLGVLESSFHGNKLRTGHLAGNHFEITLVGVDGAALERARSIATHLGASGLPNYFGAQRFGRGGDNLPQALDWLRGGGRKRLTAFLLKLYPSVVQSEVFNRYVSARTELGFERLLAGEVVRLDGSGATFSVEDPEVETPRFQRREIHPTGPMLGPKMRPAAGRIHELELGAAHLSGVDAAVLDTLGRFAPGARRDVLIHPKNLTIEASSDGRLRLGFELPAGSYATVLIREFTRSVVPEQRGAAD